MCTVDAVSSYDDDLLSSRLSGYFPISGELPIYVNPIPKGLSTTSTMAPAQKSETVTLFRPMLEAPSEPPPKHYLSRMIDLHQRLEELTSYQADVAKIQTDKDLAEIQEIEKEKEAAFHKQAEANGKRDSWNVLVNVSQYFLSASTIALGIACLPAAPWASGLLILSGALGLAGRVANDFGLFEKIASIFEKNAALQKELAGKIEMGFFFLTIGVGLAGGIAAYSTGALAAAHAAANGASIKATLARIVGTASGVFGAGARLGGAYEQKKSAHLEADMMELNSRRTYLEQGLGQDTSAVQRMVETTSGIGDEIKQAISTSVVSQD